MEVLMKSLVRISAAVFLFFTIVHGQNITLSKDSLLCKVDVADPRIAFVVYTNNVDWQISSDSIYFTVPSGDTALTRVLVGSLPTVGLSLNNNGYSYSLVNAGSHVFRMTGRTMTLQPYGGSVTLDRFRFNNCAVCNSGGYPQVWHATLTVHFDSGDRFDVTLWADGTTGTITRMGNVVHSKGPATKASHVIVGTDGRVIKDSKAMTVTVGKTGIQAGSTIQGK
jgi:hypothetical protein